VLSPSAALSGAQSLHWRSACVVARRHSVTGMSTGLCAVSAMARSRIACRCSCIASRSLKKTVGGVNEVFARFSQIVD
jgi:hypothetical protein